MHASERPDPSGGVAIEGASRDGASPRHRTSAGLLTPFELLCALGLSCNFVWCTLEGHSGGFVDSLRGLDELVNSRIFFQLGFFIIACAMIAAPRKLQRYARLLDVAIPAVSCMATLMFAWSFDIGGAAAAPLCIAGLIGSGIGYCWLVTRFYVEIMRRRGFASAAVSTALCLVVKEALLAVLLTVVPSGVQVVVAAAMPPCMAAILIAVEGAVPVRGATGGDDGARGRNDIQLGIVFAAVFGLLLSIIRGYSRLGMWGLDVLEPGTVGMAVLRVASVAAIVAAFTVLAVLPQEGRPVASRFHVPIVVVCTGLLFIFLQTYLGNNLVLDVCLQIDEFLGHMAFWASVCALLGQRPERPLRAVGIPLAVYSGTSVLFVALMSIQAMLVTGFVIVVVYAAIVLLTHNMASLAADAGTAALEDGVHETQNLASRSAVDAVGRSCEELSSKFGLSEREAQILPMVVEGRSRSYISNDLHLSDGTVKTHISRIYTKLAVSNRQELIDLVFGEHSRSDFV